MSEPFAFFAGLTIGTVTGATLVLWYGVRLTTRLLFEAEMREADRRRRAKNKKVRASEGKSP